MVITNKIKKVLFYLSPALVGFIFFIFLFKEDLQIYPGVPYTGVYSDVLNGGKTESLLFDTSQNQLSAEFILKEGFPYPYWGIYMGTGYKFHYDLTGYDYVEVELEAEHSQRIPVHILFDIPGYSDPRDPLSYRPMEQEIEYSKNQKIYKLSISKFQTQSWWFKDRKVRETEIGVPLYSRVCSFSIQNCQLLPFGKVEKIKIYRVSCKKNNLTSGMHAGIITIVLYGFLFLAIKLRKLPENVVNLKKLSIGNQADEESLKILDYISQNYSSPDISQEALQRELGLSEAKIASLLKISTNSSFKKYLNHLRLQEAKRLLQETDRQINEIAYKVGYSNVSHFNRVFKDSEQCSPNEYRNKISKNTYIGL